MGRDFNLFRFPAHDLYGTFTADRSYLAFQVADSRLFGIILNNFSNGFLGKADLILQETICLDLPRHQKLLGNMDLLELGITVQLNDLHPVPQRCRDRLQVIGRGNEYDLTQIKIQIEVMVPEGAVLCRIEDFQERTAGIAPPVTPHFIHLIEHENRVPCPGTLDGLHNTARHGTYIGSPVTSDLSLITNASQAHSGKLSPQGPGNTVPEACLADTGRTRETEDDSRSTCLRFAFLSRCLIDTPFLDQCADREVLKDTLFDILEVIVILVQDLSSIVNVVLVFTHPVPRNVQNPVQVIPNHGIFG